MLSKKTTTKLALVGASALLAAVGSSGTANAAVGVGWVGPGQANSYHAVWCVQKLIDDSPSPGSTTIDGSFGPNTETAIKQFQTWAGATPDGIVGPDTGFLLLNDFSDSYDSYCFQYLPTPNLQ